MLDKNIKMTIIDKNPVTVNPNHRMNTNVFAINISNHEKLKFKVSAKSTLVFRMIPIRRKQIISNQDEFFMLR